MPYQVIFSPTSIDDLSESVSYIARFDREAAERIGCGLIDRTEKYLAANWLHGPKCREYPERDDIRYWLCRNYRIIYRIDQAKNEVHVLRFWHCARGDLPNEIES